MKISHLFLLVPGLIVTSCGEFKNDLTKPALIGVRTPVYEGMIAAAKGEQLTWLKPLTTVYVQNVTMSINDAKFVKVTWGDSSGYIPEGWALMNGKRGVLFRSDVSQVYNDADLKTPGDATFGDWILIPAGDVTGDAIQTMYDIEGEPAFGYIEKSFVFTDSIDVAFYEAFEQSDGSMGAYEALRNDERWAKSTLRPKRFGDKASAAVSQTSPGWHREATWSFGEEDVPLTQSEIPGKFELHYAWEDDELSEINHFGDTLSNSYEHCMADFHKQVSQYLLVFTPNGTMDFTLEANINDDQRPKETSHEYTNVVAGNTYTFVIMNDSYNTGCLPVTFTVRMKDGRQGKGMISADCGD